MVLVNSVFNWLSRIRVSVRIRLSFGDRVCIGFPDVE